MSNLEFTPEFGPNGTVMNAPTMTPEMRQKIDASQRPPKADELRKTLSVPLAVGFFVFLVIPQGGPILDVLKTSLWWSGALAGAVAVGVVAIIWSTLRSCLKRWELRPSQRSGRSLDLPEWGRWLFVAADVSVASAYIAGTGWFLADVNKVYAGVPMITLLVFGAAAMFALGLRWYATECGWAWRTKTD